MNKKRKKSISVCVHAVRPANSRYDASSSLFNFVTFSASKWKKKNTTRKRNYSGRECKKSQLHISYSFSLSNLKVYVSHASEIFGDRNEAGSIQLDISDRNTFARSNMIIPRESSSFPRQNETNLSFRRYEITLYHLLAS